MSKSPETLGELSAGTLDIVCQHKKIQKPEQLFLCASSVTPFGSKCMCIYREEGQLLSTGT